MMKSVAKAPVRSIALIGGSTAAVLFTWSVVIHVWQWINAGSIHSAYLKPIWGGVILALGMIVYIQRFTEPLLDRTSLGKESLKRMWLSARAPLALCPLHFQLAVLGLSFYAVINFVAMHVIANSAKDANGFVASYIIDRPMSAVFAVLYAYAFGAAWTAIRIRKS